MKKLFILGNWKSNKTLEDAIAWNGTFSEHLPSVPETVTIILCPAFHHLPVFARHTGLALGVQDLSPYESGAFTGEVSADMVSDTVSYALLGHSERRKHFGETNEIVALKVKRALEKGIRPIVCISEVTQAVALGTSVPNFSENGLILYEPLFAIGSGKSDTPENAGRTAKMIYDVLPVPVLYGGSVTPENVKGFMTEEYLAGVGVGGASLDALKFSALIQSALT